MKKLLTLLLSVLAIVCCVAFTACSAPQGGGDEVTAQEYATAMQFSGDFKYVMTASETGAGTTETTTTEYAKYGDKLHIKSTTAGTTTEIYLNKDGGGRLLFVRFSW